VEALRTQEIGKRRALVALAFAGVLATAPFLLLHSGSASAGTAHVAGGGRTTASEASSSRPSGDSVAMPGGQLVGYRGQIAPLDPASTTSAPSTTSAAAPLTTTTAAPPTTTAPPTTLPPSPTTTTTAAPAPVAASGNSATGGATWYDTFPGGCASETLPHGVVLTVRNDATGATTTCTVDDREAPNPGRVVDLSEQEFTQIANLSQGVVTVTISWCPGVTLSRPAITALLAEHGLHPSRALGQNFVADPNTVRRIVRLAGVGAGTPVVEIGAGLGSLTLALAETGAAVVAVEVDRYLVPVLREVLAGTDVDVDVVEGDALTLDWGSLLARDPGPWSLVANLPYNVAVPVTIGVLERAPMVASLLVMVQREVGERMAARAGEDAYGAVSVKVDYWSRAEVVGRVPATVFVPRPNVESVLVRLERRSAPAVDPSLVSYDRLFSVVRAAFAQRRKMLRRSLAAIVDPEAFEAAGIAPEARAEELDVAQWGRLAGWAPPS